MHDTPQPAQAATLSIVATPIGNLRDIGLRALDVLRTADLIAAEDTRLSQTLLATYGIRARLLALHAHNEATAAAQVLAALQAGNSVAYISDAGTPGISDPGAGLVNRVRAAGLPVTPIPGPCAATAALSVAGITGPWLFVGFLPARAAARREALRGLAGLPYALVLYEAPHRVEACIADLLDILGGERELLIARELTKRFEQVHVCPLAEAAGWLASDANHRRGEFVLVIPAPGETEPDAVEGERVLQILLEELPVKQAARLAARITGGRRNALYDLALRLKAP